MCVWWGEAEQWMGGGTTGGGGVGTYTEHKVVGRYLLLPSSDVAGGVAIEGHPAAWKVVLEYLPSVQPGGMVRDERGAIWWLGNHVVLM